MFHYSLQKLEGKGVSFENLKVIPGRFLKIEFSGVRYKKEGVLFYGKDGKVVFDVLSSIKEFKPVFRDIELKSFKLIAKGTEKKKSDRFKIPDIEDISLPFKVRKVSIGNGDIEFKAGDAYFGGLFYENGNFVLKPLELNIRGRNYTFSQITGKIKEERFFVNRFAVTSDYGKVNVRAEGDIHFRTFNITISGKLRGNNFNVSLDKNLNELFSRGFLEVPQLSDKVFFDVKVKLSETVLLSGTFYTDRENLKADFNGEVSEDKVNISGFLNGNLAINNLKAEALSIEFRLVGDITAPDVIFKGKSDIFSFQNEKISNLRFAFSLKRFDQFDGKLSFKKGGTFNISVDGSLKKRKFLFSGDVRKFDLKNGFLKEAFSQEILGWIPDVKGKVVFNGEFSKNRLRKFKANFLIDKFYFRGFKGKGKLKISLLSDNKLSVNGTIKSPEGKVSLNGITDVGNKTLNLSVDVKDFSISFLDFLSKEGLSGVVNGKGIIEGKFSQLSGVFKFYSPEFAYFGERFPSVKGTLIFSYPSLFVMAKSGDGRLTVSKVAIDFLPRFSIEVSGKIRDFHLSTLEKILSRYKVKNPLILTGVATGDFDISFKAKEKNPFKMEIGISDFDGSYKLLSIVSGNATGKGKVIFDKYLVVDIKGISKNVLLSTIPFEGGNFQLSFKNTQLRISGSNFSLSFADKSKIGFDAVIDIHEKKIDAKFSMKGEKEVSPFKATFALSGKVVGTFDSFKIPITGKVSVNSNYFFDSQKFSFSGELVEPKNRGKFLFSSKNGNIELSIKDKTLNLKGELKNIALKTEKGRILIGLMFANLSVPDFDFTRINGDVDIPVISFIPDNKNLPVIYSSTGIHLTVKGMNISVSDTAFSFDGGWMEIKDFLFDGEKVRGDFIGSFDGKRLFEMAGLRKNVEVVSGKIGVSGMFKYNFRKQKLHYFVSLISDRIDMRVKFILAKLKLSNINIGIEDGKIQYLFAGISAGEGNIVISGKDKISLSAFNVPVGELGVWRARVTGNLNYDGRMVKGTVTVSRPVILKLGEKKEKSSEISLPFEADIGINFAEPLILRSQLWQMKVLPSLKFTVKDSVPVVSGNFFVLGGRIKYMGKEFQIDYGSGMIDNLLDLKGTINIASTAQINDYYIYMFIRGSLKNPVIYFSSEPPLSREQILSLLMTGATPADIEKSNEIFPVVQVAYYASSFLLKPVERQFTKILNLESFVVEPYITKYGETVFKLSLSKRIGNRLRLIGYQTTGQDPEFSVGFQYFIGRYKNFYLEYLYSNYYANEYGIGFNVRFDDWEDLKKLRLKK